mgnify:CR=1 FL=1
MVGLITFAGWIALGALSKSYLGETGELVIPVKDITCTVDDECQLITDTHEGCERRFTVNRISGWHYDVAKFYRTLKSKVTRTPIEEDPSCPPVEPGLPACNLDTNACALDPTLKSTYF